MSGKLIKDSNDLVEAHSTANRRSIAVVRNEEKEEGEVDKKGGNEKRSRAG